MRAFSWRESDQQTRCTPERLGTCIFKHAQPSELSIPGMPAEMSATSEIHVVQIHQQPQSYRPTDYNHNRPPNDRNYEAFDIIEPIETVSLSSASTGTYRDVVGDYVTYVTEKKSYDCVQTCFFVFPLCILCGAVLICLLLLALHPWL